MYRPWNAATNRRPHGSRSIVRPCAPCARSRRAAAPGNAARDTGTEIPRQLGQSGGANDYVAIDNMCGRIVDDTFRVVSQRNVLDEDHGDDALTARVRDLVPRRARSRQGLPELRDVREQLLLLGDERFDLLAHRQRRLAIQLELAQLLVERLELLGALRGR